ncbi:GNAT family N-acetyltransferase [Nioella aestuarii]|uniref:GNAT family N-acetyltransferase n=1 Tax=Nioella aestuarii TaxID=1662864 RepID=UPI003D7F4806
MPVTLSTTPPGITEFISMRAACGWGEISHDMARRALDQAVATVTAHDGDRLVGFGRVVGDGVLYFYVQDVIVAPSHRGQGIADAIVTRLLEEIAPLAGPGSTIGLMAAKGVEPLYERFGFHRRPTDSLGAGMTKLC